MERLQRILNYPLIELVSGTLTPATLLVGLAILVGSLLAARYAGRVIRRVLRGRGATAGTRFAIARIAGYFIVAVGFFVAVRSMGLDVNAVLAASAVLLVGIGFGLQNITQNFISGLILLIEQPVRRGDFIKVGGTFGIVQEIGLRATHVLTRDQVEIIVPNSELISTQVTNHSRPFTDVRTCVFVGVAYGSDTRLVKELLLQVAAAHPKVLTDPAPEVFFEDFGESSLDFALLFWITEPHNDRRISSEIRFTIDAAFREAGVQIPFPQRDLHLRSMPRDRS